MFHVLVISLYEDLGEDPRSWTHVDSNLVVAHVDYFHTKFPHTLIGLFSVLSPRAPYGWMGLNHDLCLCMSI